MNNPTNKKIKITFVINDFFIGGAQRLLVNIFSVIDREKFEVSLITLFAPSTRADFYGQIPDNVKVVKLAFHGFRDLKSWGQLYRSLKKLNPDVVSSHLFFANTAVRVLKPLLGYKVVTAVHNTYTSKTRFQIFADKILSFATAKIIAVSETVRDFTANQESIPLEKFTVIHNGIDVGGIQRTIVSYQCEALCAELALDPTKKYMVSVARLTAQKNPKLLIDGFDLFAKNNSEYELLIVGDGGMKGELEEYAGKKESASRVHFFGNRSDVYKFYCVSEFFISTSDIEGFGIAHIEAMACGIPVVTTKTAGPDRFVHPGENGFFITAKTPDAVRQAIEKMIAKISTDSSATKDSARNTAEGFDIAKMVKQYEELFASLT